ncbi:DUF4292 domain-containing protein [Flavobacteriales bacterium]|nr:DUF4292 domain-containing protein [Flavobacteriales bacterium]
MNKLFYLIIGLFILNSCSKKIINHNQYNLPTSDLEIIDQAYSNNPNYKHLNLKGIASIIIDDVETKFNINLKMIKDSVMWLSVRERVIGIELLRAKLTPDSLYLLNRLEKSFFIKSTSQFNDISTFYLNFDDFQYILFSNFTYPNSPYTYSIKNEKYQLSSQNESYNFDNKFRLTEAKITNFEYLFKISFMKYNNIDNFPRELALSILSKSNLDANIIYTKVDFNEYPSILFNIPNSYYEIH